jgi:FkbM family methyltransferase
MKCDGRTAPTRWRTALAKVRYRLRTKLIHRIKVIDRVQTLRFYCSGVMEDYRAQTLFVKEEGTINWIRDNVKPGEAFLDIGANIGLYTLVAAHQVGPSGAVYAVEPHIVNFQSLLRNVAANNFQDRVRAFSCALHDSTGVFDFNYCSLEAGTSMSQLGASRDGEEQDFIPTVVEAKLATTVDDMIATGSIRPPHHIKIDEALAQRSPAAANVAGGNQSSLSRRALLLSVGAWLRTRRGASHTERQSHDRGRQEPG